jgi:hypothetical protein
MEQTSDIDIGLMTAEDAGGVVELFRSVYGEAYPIREMYDPAFLVSQQARGDMHHVVARDRENRVIGHVAAYRTSAPFQGVWELGLGMVLPEWRNTGINKLVMEHSIKSVIPRLGIEQIWGESVANHVFMQKSSVLLGAYETGIELDLMPASSYEKEGSSSGRVSAVLVFFSYKTRGQTIFLPAPYEDILRTIYGKAPECGHVFQAADTGTRAVSPSSIKSDFFKDAGVARLLFSAIGDDAGDAAGTIEKDLIGKGAHVFQAYLRLTDPMIGCAVDALRKQGYFFGGALPRWFDDDGLMMQKIIHEPNWEGIQLYTDHAKNMLAFIRKDRQDVNSRL